MRTTLTITDAREVVLTTRQTYDVIMAEPSNPYRAGIASLFTVEYFRAISDRLADGGLYAQWLQAYEVDAGTVRTVFATLAEVFPWVETWEVGPGDLILLASRTPLKHDVARIRERMAQEPYRSALFDTWRADTVESVFAHLSAGAAFARDIRQGHLDGGGELNTDDRTVLEFGFGRQVGERGNFNTGDVLALAASRGQQRPEMVGAVDWGEVALARAAFRAYHGRADLLPGMGEAERKAFQPWQRFFQGDPRGAAADWHALGREPQNASELMVVADLLASAGDEAALPYVERIRQRQPVDAALLTAQLRRAQGKDEEVARALESAFLGMRADPWATLRLAQAGLEGLGPLTRKSPALIPPLLHALEEPFSVHVLDDLRATKRLELALREGGVESCVKALAALEPNVPFTRPVLTFRLQCYQRAGDARAALAGRDLDHFLQLTPIPFDLGLAPTSTQSSAPGG
jgi:hypothetical protein